MSNARKAVGIFVLAVLSGVLLTGCASGFLSPEAITSVVNNRGVPQLTPSGGSDVVKAQANRSVRVGSTISGTLRGSHVSSGFGDMDWIKVEGLNQGDQLATQLTATGNFDIGIIQYINGSWQWSAFNDDVYRGPKAITATVRNAANTWIFVGAWASDGNYTVTVGTQKTVREYFSITHSQATNAVINFGYQYMGTFTLYELWNLVSPVITLGCVFEVADPTTVIKASCMVIKAGFDPNSSLYVPDGSYDWFCATVSYYRVEGIPVSCMFFPTGWIPRN